MYFLIGRFWLKAQGVIIENIEIQYIAVDILAEKLHSCAVDYALSTSELDSGCYRLVKAGRPASGNRPATVDTVADAIRKGCVRFAREDFERSGWGACLNGSLILGGKEFSPIGGWIYNRRTADEANRELGVANWKPGDFNAYDASDYGFWPEVLDRLMGEFGISFSEDGYERYRERETLAFALGDVCRAAWRKLNIRDYQPYQAYLKEGREEA